MGKTLYVASGPLHAVIEIIHRLEEGNLDEYAELMIVNIFDGAERLADRIRQAKIFSSVNLMSQKELYFLYCELKIWAWEKNNIPKVARKIKRIYGMYISDYETIYIAGNVLGLQNFCWYQHVICGTKIFLIDDGLGSRMGLENLHPIKCFLRQSVRIYHLIDIRDYVDGQLFFSIDKVSAKRDWKFIQQKKASEETKAKLMGALMNEDSKCGRIMYFTAGFENYKHLARFSDADYLLAKILANKYPECEIMYHPGLAKNREDQRGIFEIDILNCESNNLLIISACSAACFNPKFMYDMEPWVILTYKLVGMNKVGKVMFGLSDASFERQLYKNLIGAYIDSSKICIPNTLEEAYQFIQKYRETCIKE